MGLTLIESMVRQLQGESSRYNDAGAIFTLLLKKNCIVGMKSFNVLVVEDEILIAETIKIYLEERGHQVINIAISFDEALQAYHLRRPDMVLLDIRLYGQNQGLILQISYRNKR